jgi:hypothetical protein
VRSRLTVLQQHLLHGLRVAQVVEQNVGLVRLELLAGEVAGGHGDRACAAGPGAGDVSGRVADDHDVRILGGLAEPLSQPGANDRHQARAVGVIGAVGAQVEVEIAVDPGAREFQLRDGLQVAGQQ